MTSYVELRPPAESGHPGLRVDLPVEIVRDLATMPRPDWLERTIEAIHRQAPQREAAMRAALSAAMPQSVMLFVTDAEEPGKTRIDALRWVDRREPASDPPPA
ncbi:hypothetical protein [Desertibaculum subflavum]|uniref:hypothetical protein n=1 Tax=Desertibaculum subflavum TaxID=2268458 RepID=UPI000E673537